MKAGQPKAQWPIWFELSAQKDYSIKAEWSLPQIKTLDWERHLHFTLPFHFTHSPSFLLYFHCTGNMTALYSTGASQLKAITINCISLIPSTVFLSVCQLYLSQFVKLLWQAGGGVLNWGLQLLLGNSVLYHSHLTLPMIQSPHLPNTLLGFKPKHTEANRIDRNLQNFLPCAFNASSKCGRRILHNIP